LLKHGLKLHGREIVHQLISEVAGGGNVTIRQSDADRRAVAELLQVLARAERQAAHCCDAEDRS
jgi:hypothetical protein